MISPGVLGGAGIVHPQYLMCGILVRAHELFLKSTDPEGSKTPADEEQAPLPQIRSFMVHEGQDAAIQTHPTCQPVVVHP